MADPLLAMNFAIINGQRVPVDDGEEFDLKEEVAEPEFDLKEEPFDVAPELPEETPTALRLLERAMTPLVDLPAGVREKMAEFEQVHPVLGAIGRNAVDFTLGESSPLSLMLGGLGAAEGAASQMGMERAAQLMRIPSRIAAGGLALHGYNKLNEEDQSIGSKIGALAEMGLGGLGAFGKFNRGAGPELERVPEVAPQAIPELNVPISLELPEPKIGTPPFNTSQFGLMPHEIDLPYPLNVTPNRLRPASTNATVFDALLPERLKLNEQGAATPPTLSIGNERAPRELIRPIDMARQEEEKKFVYNIWDRLKTLGTSERGELKLSGLKARDELNDALNEATMAREMQEDIYREERAKRFKKVESVSTTGRKGFYERLSKLKGKMPKEILESIKVKPDSARALYNEIQRSNLSTPEKIRASVGLGKLLGDYEAHGRAPQRNEIELLRKVFGDGTADKIIQMHSGVPITKQALNEVMNFSKSLMASFDASAPFRQGLPLIHTSQFWKNYGKMFSYLGKDAYKVAMESIHKDPMFEAIRNAGIRFTEIGEELGAREEQFMSKLAEKIPGIPASERMYTGFLNKLRFDTAKRLMNEAEQAGLKPFIKNGNGETITTDLGRQIADYVNNATGRGSLGRLEKNAVELNSLFFSPRLISSRLTLLNPMYYVKADPFVRKQALKSLFAIAGAGKIFEELGKMAGGTVDLNPTSSDYHKLKVGNTRLDPYGGFQQYIVAASKLIAGKTTSTTSGKVSELGKGVTPSRAAMIFGIGGRTRSFMENKFSPLIGFADDMITGRKNEGGTGSEVANLFVPMIIQDTIELAKEDPSLVPLALLGAQGIGMQTYSGKTSGSRELVR